MLRHPRAGEAAAQRVGQLGARLVVEHEATRTKRRARGGPKG
ncbi:hypothetical protein [Burkholderia alba]|nr:hypothetical protein [Burkholderia alba]